LEFCKIKGLKKDFEDSESQQAGNFQGAYDQSEKVQYRSGRGVVPALLQNPRLQESDRPHDHTDQGKKEGCENEAELHQPVVGFPEENRQDQEKGNEGESETDSTQDVDTQNALSSFLAVSYLFQVFFKELFVHNLRLVQGLRSYYWLEIGFLCKLCPGKADYSPF